MVKTVPLAVFIYIRLLIISKVIRANIYYCCYIVLNSLFQFIPVPKAEISRKIHGLDTYDLSPTVAAPRKRPPSASEWPAMTLPTRVATPTTDTAESDDDTDSDNDETVAPEPTFKPIAAVRTNSPLTKTFAPELPSPKPLGVSVESLPQPQPLSQPQPQPLSQPQPKPLSKPVPVSRRISGSSKSPPTRRQHIDTTLSPLEDTPLHDRQKNAFADFFSKKKTPEEEKASVDLLLPKTTNIDQNKVIKMNYFMIYIFCI